MKTFLVQCAARFDSPSEAAKAANNEFGIPISRQLAAAYDPTSPSGRNLSQQWREVFEATRAAHLKDVSGIGISHRAVRLRTLDRLAHRAEEAGNLALVAQLLEQAAREMGQSFTNKRQVEVAASISAAPKIHDGMSIQEAADAYAALLRESPFPN